MSPGEVTPETQTVDGGGETVRLREVIQTMLELADERHRDIALADYLRHRLDVIEYEFGLHRVQMELGSLTAFAEFHFSCGLRLDSSRERFSIIDLGGALEVPEWIGKPTNEMQSAQSELEAEARDLDRRIRDFRRRWLRDVLTRAIPQITELSTTESQLRKRGLGKRPRRVVADPWEEFY